METMPPIPDSIFHGYITDPLQLNCLEYRKKINSSDLWPKVPRFFTNPPQQGRIASKCRQFCSFLFPLLPSSSIETASVCGQKSQTNIVRFFLCDIDRLHPPPFSVVLRLGRLRSFPGTSWTRTNDSTAILPYRVLRTMEMPSFSLRFLRNETHHHLFSLRLHQVLSKLNLLIPLTAVDCLQLKLWRSNNYGIRIFPGIYREQSPNPKSTKNTVESFVEILNGFRSICAEIGKIERWKYKKREPKYPVLQI